MLLQQIIICTFLAYNCAIRTLPTILSYRHSFCFRFGVAACLLRLFLALPVWPAFLHTLLIGLLLIH